MQDPGPLPLLSQKSLNRLVDDRSPIHSLAKISAYTVNHAESESNVYRIGNVYSHLKAHFHIPFYIHFFYGRLQHTREKIDHT